MTGRLFLLEELTPPLELLQIIVSWIQDDLRLVLITFLNTPLSGNQPINSLDITPLGGLVRWCVKAPLAYRGDKKLPLTNGATESELDVGPLFSTLHLSVLQVRLLPPAMPACLVNARKERYHWRCSFPATSRSSCCCPPF